MQRPRMAVIGLASLGVLAGCGSASGGSGVGVFAWTSVPAPANTKEAQLAAISCVSTTDCWAVGTSGKGQPLVVHATASGWAVASAPTFSGGGGLNAVTCWSVTECWAVGDANSGSQSGPQIFGYVSGSWQAIPSDVQTAATSLYGIACAAADDCWAVGEVATPSASTPESPLIEHWDGSEWTMVSAPVPYDTSAAPILGSVSCPSVAVCWAVGGLADGSGLIERYTDGAWSTPEQYPDVQWNGVSCTSPVDCWAVGVVGGGTAIAEPIVGHYTGGDSWDE